MQKVSYMGKGTTTEFYLNFPYFENSNIIVTKNNATATGYNIIGTSGGVDADIPYTGGKVVFDVAPTALDSITIARNLPLSRSADYQPTARIEPTVLNQDANYLMEVIKDLQDELDSLCAQYADIADKESTTTLLARISAIHDEIVAVSAQITALGDISTLRSDVTNNANDITSLKDASNFTATGKAAIVNLNMPSSSAETLTLGASGATYTAPADGWFALSKATTADGQFVQLGEYGKVSNFCWSGSQYNACITSLPVQKNQTIKIEYTAGGSATFKFYYANGAQ